MKRYERGSSLVQINEIKSTLKWKKNRSNLDRQDSFRWKFNWPSSSLQNKREEILRPSIDRSATNESIGPNYGNEFDWLWRWPNQRPTDSARLIFGNSKSKKLKMSSRDETKRRLINRNGSSISLNWAESSRVPFRLTMAQWRKILLWRVWFHSWVNSWTLSNRW